MEHDDVKRETHRHPKLLDLMSRLNCSRPAAIGYLTLLWDFTAEYAIQGDIGKHSNGAIARACDYEGNAQIFIDALVGARWIDEDPDYRLLVHAWEEHCERWIKLKIEKLKKSFIKPFAERSIKASTEAPTKLSPEGSALVTNPIQSNPKPNQPVGAEPPAPPKKSGSKRVPQEFQVTEDLLAWAKEHTPGVDVRRETEKFRDHEFAQPRKDWIAAWRNWMRKAEEISGARKPGGTPQGARPIGSIPKGEVC